ncbi:MAG: hypothetical protein ACRDRG_08970 [Pseudonocardiaceae bacterium]
MPARRIYQRAFGPDELAAIATAQQRAMDKNRSSSGRVGICWNGPYAAACSSVRNLTDRSDRDHLLTPDLDLAHYDRSQRQRLYRCYSTPWLSPLDMRVARTWTVMITYSRLCTTMVYPRTGLRG